MERFLNRAGSAVWSVLSALSRKASRQGRKLPARVISVGNLQAGGAGKTPLVAQVAREAAARGLTACILCRGYGGFWERRGGVIAPGEACPETALCGDEAALLHELAPQAWIGVGADRRARFDEIVGRAGKRIDLVILDDGFQNHLFRKDLEIVALTSASRSERLFRDGSGALRHAQLIVWTKGEKDPLGPRGRERVSAPFIRARFKLAEAAERLAVHLVTGVGDGKAALATAQAAGYRVATHVCFPDHARYPEQAVRGILEEARRQGVRVAVTGKDWVKWRELLPGPAESSGVVVLEPELCFEKEDQRIWNHVLWGE